MKEINIFDDKYVELFCPYDGVEFIQNIILGLGYTNKNLSSQKAKKEALIVIEELLNLNLIYVFHWGQNHSSMVGKVFTIKQTINYIDSLWFQGAGYSDFYGMVMFGYKKWYVEELEKLGMTHTTNWKEFVKNKIGNLEKWIEDNKPKNT